MGFIRQCMPTFAVIGGQLSLRICNMLSRSFDTLESDDQGFDYLEPPQTINNTVWTCLSTDVGCITQLQALTRCTIKTAAATLFANQGEASAVLKQGFHVVHLQ